MKRGPSSNTSESSYEDEEEVLVSQSKPKKKRSRKHSSCENCRTRKVKCDRQSSCSNCRMHGVECSWSDAAPTSVSDSDIIKSLREEIDRLHALVNVLAQQAVARDNIPTPLPPLDPLVVPTYSPFPAASYPSPPSLHEASPYQPCLPSPAASGDAIEDLERMWTGQMESLWEGTGLSGLGAVQGLHGFGMGVPGVGYGFPVV